MASEVDELYALSVLLESASAPRDLVAAFRTFGLEISLLNAPVAATLLRSAVAGDTSAAKMWLINRDAQNWSTRSRGPQTGKTAQPIDDDSPETAANPLDGLRLIA